MSGANQIPRQLHERGAMAAGTDLARLGIGGLVNILCPPPEVNKHATLAL